MVSERRKPPMKSFRWTREACACMTTSCNLEGIEISRLSSSHRKVENKENVWQICVKCWAEFVLNFIDPLENGNGVVTDSCPTFFFFAFVKNKWPNYYKLLACLQPCKSVLYISAPLCSVRSYCYRSGLWHLHLCQHWYIQIKIRQLDILFSKGATLHRRINAVDMATTIIVLPLRRFPDRNVSLYICCTRISRYKYTFNRSPHDSTIGLFQIVRPSLPNPLPDWSLLLLFALDALQNSHYGHGHSEEIEIKVWQRCMVSVHIWECPEGLGNPLFASWMMLSGRRDEGICNQSFMAYLTCSYWTVTACDKRLTSCFIKALQRGAATTKHKKYCRQLK